MKIELSDLIEVEPTDLKQAMLVEAPDGSSYGIAGVIQRA
jgi:hypothetical protein